jgi:hypothetical protein
MKHKSAAMARGSAPGETFDLDDDFCCYRLKTSALRRYDDEDARQKAIQALDMYRDIILKVLPERLGSRRAGMGAYFAAKVDQ